MPKLVLTRGLPASGKSTWASEWVISGSEDDQRVRLNRDDLRFSFFTKPTYGGVQEKFITEIERDAAKRFLRKGVSVVVDATNLRPVYCREWRKLAASCGAEFEIREFPITLQEAIIRDSRRSATVGAEVVTRMYERYLKKGELQPVPDEELQPEVEQYMNTGDRPTCIIVDIDGTLAHMNGRSPYDLDRVGEDTLSEPVARVVGAVAPHVSRVFVFSGREDSCRDATNKWLHTHSVLFDKLVMRRAGDRRKDSIVKREIFDEHVRDKYDVLAVFDDRDQVVDMWRSMGLTCLQVAPGDF